MLSILAGFATYKIGGFLLLTKEEVEIANHNFGVLNMLVAKCIEQGKI